MPSRVYLELVNVCLNKYHCFNDEVACLFLQSCVANVVDVEIDVKPRKSHNLLVILHKHTLLFC